MTTPIPQPYVYTEVGNGTLQSSLSTYDSQSFGTGQTSQFSTETTPETLQRLTTASWWRSSQTSQLSTIPLVMSRATTASATSGTSRTRIPEQQPCVPMRLRFCP